MSGNMGGYGQQGGYGGGFPRADGYQGMFNPSSLYNPGGGSGGMPSAYGSRSDWQGQQQNWGPNGYNPYSTGTATTNGPDIMSGVQGTDPNGRGIRYTPEMMAPIYANRLAAFQATQKPGMGNQALYDPRYGGINPSANYPTLRNGGFVGPPPDPLYPMGAKTLPDAQQMNMPYGRYGGFYPSPGGWQK